MTGLLQRLFIGLLIMLMLACIGDVILGVPVELADRSEIEDWGGYTEAQLLRERVLTALWLLPWVALLGATIWSIKRKRAVVFYWAFLLGLSILQIIPTMALIQGPDGEPVFLRRLLLAAFGLFLSGQLLALWQLVRQYRRRVA